MWGSDRLIHGKAAKSHSRHDAVKAGGASSHTLARHAADITADRRPSLENSKVGRRWELWRLLFVRGLDESNAGVSLT
jgi:hypothetical protein